MLAVEIDRYLEPLLRSLVEPLGVMATPVGAVPRPRWIVSVTVSVEPLRTLTELESVFVTYTAPLAVSTATPVGPDPTRTVVVTVFLAASMTLTVPEPLLAT